MEDTITINQINLIADKWTALNQIQHQLNDLLKGKNFLSVLYDLREEKKLTYHDAHQIIAHIYSEDYNGIKKIIKEVI